MNVRPMTKKDWKAVANIYEAGIATGNATFETTAPSWETWNKNHLASCRFVAEQDETIAGWVALSPVSSRCVYGGVAEVSVYISPDFRKKGVGKLLMQLLISASEEAGFWTLQAAMFPENKGSIALHLKMGFRKIGVREKIGKMNGVWRDNLLMERRSQLSEYS